MSSHALWQALSGKNIFLTGGTGFIGTCLLESFIAADNVSPLDIQLTVLTRDPEAYRKKYPEAYDYPCIDFYAGDVRNFEFLPEKFDVVLHGATDASAALNEENPFLMFDTITAGTRRVLEFAGHCSAKKFLFVSSGAVYGRQPTDSLGVSEHFLQGPRFDDVRSAYGIGKVAAEHLCCLAARRYGFEVSIARCFAFVGPWLPLDIHFAIGNFIRDALSQKVIRVNGDGTPLRSWLYSGELVEWLLTVLLKGKHLTPYNVGSDEVYSVSEAARIVAEVAGGEARVEIACAPQEGVLPERYLPDISRAREELGLSPKIGLREGVRLTMDWYRERHSSMNSIPSVIPAKAGTHSG